MTSRSDNSHFGTHSTVEDSRNESIMIYVNGELLPRDQAKVSVYDSGFMLGDGVWEGMRLHNGKFLFADLHLDRLFDGARAIDLDIGKTREELLAALKQTVDANGMQDGVHVRLMVTRGPKRTPFQDPRLSDSGPTIVIIAEFKTASTEPVEKGIRMYTVHVRRGAPDVQDPKLNSHSKLNCITAMIQAYKAGCDEALMLDPHGFVSTGNSVNFFIVRKGEVWTSTGDYCMPGITRAKVIELCMNNDIPVFQRNFSLHDAYSADEAFVTGTFGAQVPVIELDGRVIGDGRPGDMTRRIRRLYEELIARECPPAD
ncbi:MAG: D-amino acid aminotransferase [Gammaproteobacteria bacterium]|nr:D-amino acid aminotransferase [Gammaproteobacteria bacterium]